MPNVARVVVESLVVGLLAIVATAAAVAALLGAIAGATALPPLIAFLMKLGFAALLSAIVTPIAIKRLLRDRPNGAAQSGNPT